METRYYLDLITSQYRDKPKFIAWLTAAVNKIQGVTNLAEMLDVAFDIDKAKGAQLDVLGHIVGQQRRVNFQPTDGSSPVLSDEYYRVLLKAKIIKNIWRGSVEDLQPVWETLFPGGQIIVKDNQDMTIDVGVLGVVPSVVRDLVKYGYIVPKPQSVGVNYFFFGTAPVFGYDIDNEYISGYDKGKWGMPENITLFGYGLDDLSVSGYDKGAW